MMNLVDNMLKRRAESMSMGVLHTLGGNMETFDKGKTTMSWLQGNFHFGQGSLTMTKRGPVGRGTQIMSGLGVLAGIGTLGYSMYGGYQEDGVWGAMRGAALEIGVDSAMVKYGYHKYEEGGVTKFGAGATNPRLLRKFGALGNAAASAKGFAGYVGRYGVGSTIAAATSKALGGGMVGTAAGVIAGGLGVRYAGTIGLGLAAAAPAILAAKGTYSLLKAGHAHQQRRKSINTDGDMSAFMTEGAFTMRSRAVQAISKSHMNARSALGQEAQLFHTPSRSYHSAYRSY